MNAPAEERTPVRRPRRRRGPGLGVALIAAALAIGALFAWYSRRDAEPEAADEAALEALAAAEASAPEPIAPAGAPLDPAAQALPPAEEPVEVPPLAESDGFVREQVGPLSPHPALASWLAQGDLAQRFAASVDNVAEGKSPRAHLRFLRPREPFRVLGTDANPRVDPASYARYDAIADVVESLDAAACASVYRRLALLFQQAYEALGYPDRRFDERAVAAIDVLLAAPVLEESPPLVRHVGRYHWADPELQRAPDAVKQLLRMGPRNVARVQAKLRELRAAIAPAAGDWDDGPREE
ncbi:MAG: DUF3014 domain-containing protein [Proteobacteria bacterium]|nr:MAG: DUF3014 domain-containing protein [Pseudomonadota bacterium]